MQCECTSWCICRSIMLPPASCMKMWTVFSLLLVGLLVGLLATCSSVFEPGALTGSFDRKSFHRCASGMFEISAACNQSFSYERPSERLAQCRSNQLFNLWKFCKWAPTCKWVQQVGPSSQEFLRAPFLSIVCSVPARVPAVWCLQPWSAVDKSSGHVISYVS